MAKPRSAQRERKTFMRKSRACWVIIRERILNDNNYRVLLMLHLPPIFFNTDFGGRLFQRGSRGCCRAIAGSRTRPKHPPAWMPSPHAVFPIQAGDRKFKGSWAADRSRMPNGTITTRNGHRPCFRVQGYGQLSWQFHQCPTPASPYAG